MVFQIGDKVKVPSRNDGLIYETSDIYKDGHKYLKLNQVRIFNDDADDGCYRAFIANSEELEKV